MLHNYLIDSAVRVLRLQAQIHGTYPRLAELFRSPFCEYLSPVILTFPPLLTRSIMRANARQCVEAPVEDGIMPEGRTVATRVSTPAT